MRLLNPHRQPRVLSEPIAAAAAERDGARGDRRHRRPRSAHHRAAFAAARASALDQPTSCASSVSLASLRSRTSPPHTPHPRSLSRRVMCGLRVCSWVPTFYMIHAWMDDRWWRWIGTAPRTLSRGTGQTGTPHARKATGKTCSSRRDCRRSKRDGCGIIWPPPRSPDGTSRHAGWRTRRAWPPHAARRWAWWTSCSSFAPAQLNALGLIERSETKASVQGESRELVDRVTTVVAHT